MIFSDIFCSSDFQPPPPMKQILVCLDMSYSFSRDLWRGIVRYSFENNRWALWPARGGVLWEEISNVQYDGVIGMFGDPVVATRLMEHGTPIINVSNRGFKIPSVINDDEAVGRMAAEYYLAKGFQNFCYYGYDSINYSRMRERGFRTRVEAAGFKCLSVNHKERREFTTWLATVPVSTAILCADDNVAFSVIRGCWELDIPVPQHLAVMGVNNDETYCLNGTVGLSSVMLASERLGFLAAQQLDRQMGGEAPITEPIKVAPLNVVSRMSTDMQSVHDELVRRALRYIQNNVHRAIQVSDLLDYLSVSRRTLERRFQAKLGHSPHHAISRARVEMAKRLLEATDMKMEDIAQNCGFSEARILYRNFRLITGISPARYRKGFN